jgi:hypothetical protein
MFVEMMEAMALAGFLGKTEKQPYVRIAIRKLDTLKILLMIVWETKSIDDKKYLALSVQLDEVGKMLGGWNGQLTKQNSPNP